MDIFEWAESVDYGADYFDNDTGYIYHIQEAKRTGNKNSITVTDSEGNLIGMVNKN